MRRILTFCVLIAVALVLGSGCFSYSTLHTAKPIEQGKTETTLASSYYGWAIPEGSLDVPTVEVGVRHGLTPDLDLGAKLFLIGLAADVNYAVINEPSFALSLNPYITMTRANFGDASITMGFALFNILADVVSTDMATVTLGLKPGLMYAVGSTSEESDFGTGAVVGGMAGVKLRLTDTFSLMPNVDILTPVENMGDLVFYNAGVAVMY